MKPVQLKYYALVVQLILLGACAPQATPSPTETPTPPVVSVDLVGPQMQVGSTFLYADGAVLVAVPGGIFTRGGGGPDNLVQQIDVSDFWIYSTKVTNGQYAYCVAAGLCTRPVYKADNPLFDDPTHANDPMVGVNYDQALTYCAFVNARLPTEAEWEKVARGPNANLYPWGDGAPSCELLNYGICVGMTSPVTTYPMGRSYYRAFDMEGNALEWVADWYQADYYLTAPQVDPPGPDKGRERVVRSSAFNSGGDQTPTFARFHSSPDTHRDNLSFRCVVEDPTYFAPFCNYPATYGTDGIGGASSGGTPPDVHCPVLSITQDPQCDGNPPQPITYVTFSTDGTPHLTGTCSGPNANGQYECTGNGNLSNCGYCKVHLYGDPQCPNGYTLDEPSHTCIGQPVETGACLPGFTLDHHLVTRTNQLINGVPDTPTSAAPAGQCCAFDPPDPCGPGHDPQDPFCQPPFPHCPPGTLDDGHECISTVLQPLCNSQGIALNSCTSGGGGDDTSGCPPPPGGCSMTGEEWNSTTCSCYCPAGPGFCG